MQPPEASLSFLALFLAGHLKAQRLSPCMEHGVGWEAGWGVSIFLVWLSPCLKGRVGSSSFLLKIVCACVLSCLYVCLHLGIHRGQKRTSEPVKLELEALVSHPV